MEIYFFDIDRKNTGTIGDSIYITSVSEEKELHLNQS